MANVQVKWGDESVESPLIFHLSTVDVHFIRIWGVQGRNVYKFSFMCKNQKKKTLISEMARSSDKVVSMLKYKIEVMTS